MYKISKQNGEVIGITESPTYIKLHPNGGFTLAGEADAIGVAYRSVPYNLIGHDDIDGAETVVVSEMDGGASAAAVGVLLGGMSDLGGLAVQFRRAVRLFADSLDDVDALSVASVYDEWASGVDYKAGQHVRWRDKLYRVLQAHTSQADWPPDVAVSLYERIDVAHAGTLADPIPYDGNMALVSGLYYTQDGVVYRCTRDTGIAVYAALRDLVGLYVEEVSMA
jgi:hypothetical protein